MSDNNKLEMNTEGDYWSQSINQKSIELLETSVYTLRVYWPKAPTCSLAEGPWPYSGPTLGATSNTTLQILSDFVRKTRVFLA